MKLLRKDVLKWIKALKSGQYKKGKETLVSKDGIKFCCLGVWADMHGCTWDDSYGSMVPIPRGRKAKTVSQNDSVSFLNDSKLARGLDRPHQRELACLNDASVGFKKVIKYIEKEILPLAK